jgi:RNA polymerase sigma factor (sigma-70 family)
MCQTPKDQLEELEGHRPRLRKLLSNVLGSNVDPRLAARIDESAVIQETMMKAIPALRRGRIADLRPWLNNIMQRALLAAIRKASRGGLGPSLDAAADESVSRVQLWIAADQTSPSEQLARSEREQHLAQAFARLNEDEWRVVDLCLRKNYSRAQAAQEIGRTPAAVNGLLTRALKKLREDLGGGDPGFSQ